MATDLTALAETFARYSRQVAGLTEPLTLPPADGSPGVEPARERMAERLAKLDAPGPFGAAWLQQLWLGSLKDIRYLDEGPYAAALDRFIAAAEDGLRFVATCQAAVGSANGEGDVPPELAKAGQRYAFVLKTARDKKDVIGKPFVPRDPERFAEAMRRAAEGSDRSLTVDEAVAYFRSKRGES